jgi:hypothetical protein
MISVEEYMFEYKYSNMTATTKKRRNPTCFKLITYGHKDWFKEEKELPRSDVLPPKRRGSHA